MYLYQKIIIYVFFFLNLVCKSCLVKHLEENNSCPTCQIVIHQSHPLQYISFDRTMQDIVFKLVPGLQLGMYIGTFVYTVALEPSWSISVFQTFLEE